MSDTAELKAGQYQDLDKKSQFGGLVLLYPLEERGGFAFTLTFVDHKHLDQKRLFSVLQERLERLVGSFGKESNIQHRFEQFLSAVNEDFAAMVKDGEWSFPISNLHSIVGLATDNQMFLSGTGDLEALYTHKKPDQTYQVYNLFRSIQTEQALPTWEKTYAVVLDGDLHTGDVFIVANQELQRTLKNEDLLSIITKLPPSSACVKVRQHFDHNKNLSMILIKALNKETSTVDQAQQLSGVSIDKLNRTEKDTSTLLEDQKLGFIPIIFKKLKTWRQTKPDQNQSPKNWLIRIKGILKFAWIIRKNLKKATNLFKQKEKSTKTIEEAVEKADESVKKIFRRLRQVPQTSKILAFAAIGVLIVFSVTVYIMSQSKAESVVVDSYQTKLTELEEVLSKADGAMIYRDEDQAREFYNQAWSLVDQLPTDPAGDNSQLKQDYLEKINNTLDELRHITKIPEPPLVADLAALAEKTFGRSLIKQENDLFILTNQKSAFKVNLSDKSLTRVLSENEQIGLPLKSAFDENFAVFLDERPGIGKFDFETEKLINTNTAPDENIRWADVALYNSRLYVLEPSGGQSEGQIIRFNQSGDGFGAGTKWINSKTTDLSDAVSLSIDATIFVLKQNGEVIQFIKGAQVGYDVEKVDPEITAATDLWTDSESSFLYILEPSTKRLIIFKKETGKFLIQYQSKEFEGLKDFLVDEEKRLIYFLAGSKVYSISASFLE
ncbi:hypothetical protein ACFLZY_01340 [Patescibacteria group bacterium]